MTCSTISRIERRAYAPELNRVQYTNGIEVRAPGITTVQQYREKFQPRQFTIMAEVRSLYPTNEKWLEKVRSGRVASRTEAIQARKKLQSQLAPGGKAILKTWIIG